MTAPTHAGADHRSRPAIPTSAFTHRRSRVCGDGLTLRVVRPLVEAGGVLGVVDESSRGGPVQLVLTSHGPIATHSVWHDHGLGGGDVRELAAEAQDNVRRAGELFAEVGISRPATPVVVVWGPDETVVPSGGKVLHDVVFVRGSDLSALLGTSFGRGDALTADDARDLAARLGARRGQDVVNPGTYLEA